jgi:hypothetical protein
MPQLKFFEEVEIPNDVPFFLFPWRKPTFRKNDNVHPKRKLLPIRIKSTNEYQTLHELNIALET